MVPAERERVTSVQVIGGSPSQRERFISVLAGLGVQLAGESAGIVVLLQSSDQSVTTLRGIRERFGPTPVIFVADSGSERLAVDAFRAGASDYLVSPVTPAMVSESLRRVRAPAGETPVAPLLLGESAAITHVRAAIARIAPTPCSVLITGETGTGKEVVARLIHRYSRRAGQPFVSINCSALPETLFESELFGYERGAFTGAQASSKGRFQAADGGTVFLDEVGELSLVTQPKLLRAIDRREVQRLGSRRQETIDVRWLAATNRDLEQSVREGLFRADLFYRLNVYSLVIPPLRERPEDVVVLAHAFLSELAAAYGRAPAVFADEALVRLVAYEWPGNVRELRNVVESGLLNAESSTIGAEALPAAVRGADCTIRSETVAERVRVVEALRASGGNKSEAAHRLKWSRMTLYRKLARHRIDVTEECDTVTAKPSRR